MFRRLLTYVAIAFLALQIPVVISLWPSAKLSSAVSKLESEIKTEFAEKAEAPTEQSLTEQSPAEQASVVQDEATQKAETQEEAVQKSETDETSGIKEEVKESTPRIAKLLDKITPAITTFKAWISHAARIFWGSILLALLLALVLYFLDRKKYLRNIGTASILGGIFLLLKAFFIHHYLVRNFSTTFDYVYTKITELYTPFSTPIVRTFFEKVSPGFVQGIASNMITRNTIWGFIFVGGGLIAWLIYKTINKGKKEAYTSEGKEGKGYYQERKEKNPYCTQEHIDRCRKDCREQYKDLNNHQCEANCIDKYCSHKTAAEYKDRGKKE